MTSASSDLSTLLIDLVLWGATWKEPTTKEDSVVVRTLNGIRYGVESPMQSLDITFPNEHITFNEDDTATDSKPPRPVFIFIHGGGWTRGSKSNRFYGAPGMCENMAAKGMIAIAPGYRRGSYPTFMHDAALAIQWVSQNIQKLNGDKSRVFLSGHSAGGHIASLLMVRYEDYLAPLDISLDFFHGMVLVSGVYSLFNPMSNFGINIKNNMFQLAYVMPAFGTKTKQKINASPLLLLNPDEYKKAKNSMLKTIARKLSSIDNTEEISESESKDEESEIETEVSINTTLPRTLILNASFDMGLQKGGGLMTEAMSQYTNVQHTHVPWTDHASICWNIKTANIIEKFVMEPEETTDIEKETTS